MVPGAVEGQWRCGKVTLIGRRRGEGPRVQRAADGSSKGKNVPEGQMVMQAPRGVGGRGEERYFNIREF